MEEKQIKIAEWLGLTQSKNSQMLVRNNISLPIFEDGRYGYPFLYKTDLKFDSSPNWQFICLEKIKKELGISFGSLFLELEKKYSNQNKLIETKQDILDAIYNYAVKKSCLL